MGRIDIKLSAKYAVKATRIGVAGFESHSKAAMNLFFAQQEPLLTLVPLEQAEVLVLDMEHPVIPSLLAQHQNLCAIVAVTATEKEFPGLVTVRKPLNSKQLITAIQSAKKGFIRPSANQPDEQQKVNSVSREGEEAFQKYQKRIADSRKAMEKYQQRAAGRDSVSSQLPKQHQPKKVSGAVEAVNGSKNGSVRGSQPDSLELDNQDLKPVAKNKAAVTLPAAKAVAEKKTVEKKAKFSSQMISECCGNAPDINMHEKEQRRRVFFKDESTLLVMLQEAIVEANKQFCPVEVEGLPGSLVYLPAQQRFMFGFAEELLIPLALTRFGYQELKINERPDISDDASKSVDANIKLERGDELIWKIALWTSKGRLNKTIDPDKRYQLAADLDFNRLLATPHATTINSLWRRHSLSVLEVVKVLKISQRYVFSFMSAAQALGIFK